MEDRIKIESMQIYNIVCKCFYSCVHEISQEFGYQLFKMKVKKSATFLIMRFAIKMYL